MCRKFSFFVSFVLVLSLVSSASAVEFASQDVGGPAIPGGSSEAAGVWTVSGSGNDIWANADQFHYVFRPVSGDVDFEVTLNTMTNVHDWMKVGVMIRETTAAGSKHATMALTGANGWQFLYRDSTDGGSSAPPTGIPYIFPEKMRIKRIVGGGGPGKDKLEGWYWRVVIAGVFEFWERLGDVNMPAMADDVYIGLAVTSHDNGVLATAEFSGVGWPAAPFNKAWNLQPEDGTTKVPLTPTLSWMAGDTAASHDVYLGTDAGALPLVASQALGNESFTPAAPLDEATDYYWQIVEQPGNHASAVMNFKTTRTGTGTIDICVWDNMGGGLVSDLTNNARYPDSPTWCGELTVFDTTQSLGDTTGIWDNYGLRIQGFLVPEISGTYTFWITSDDASQLFLSSSEKGCNAQLIARENGWAGYHDYDGNASRKSAPVSLVGGQKYFIRALMKEGTGGDHCSVAWEGPDSPSRTEIDGFYLTGGFVDRWASNPSVSGLVTPLEAETLSFQAAPGATAHDVYFGEAGSMALIATLPAGVTSVDVMVEDGKSYEWQVNEVFGAEVEEGCPWTFSVQLWISRDIGRANPNPAGSASFDAGTGIYTLQSGGSELWTPSDEFHYFYTTMKLTRDTGSIQAQILSNSNNSSWTRAGVMFRGSPAANAQKIMSHNTGHDNTRMQWRNNPGDGTGNSGDNWGLGRPIWVRLDRDGDRYEGYRSKDGVNWTSLGVHNVSMGGNFAYVGLALCHHLNLPQDQLTTATFDNLSITTPDPLQAWGLDPENGATAVDIHATLRWNPGEGVNEHHVYFSDDEDAVVNRTVAPTILPAETTELAVGPLDLTKNYYWAVDEAINPVTLGEVHSFTAENYRTIDDFEAYDIEPEAIPPQVFIPGEILVASTPPPDQSETEAGFTVMAEALPAQELIPGEVVNEDAVTCTDPDRGLVLCLDGDGDYVNCGNPAALNFGTGDWTLSAWVRNTMTGTGDDNKGGIITNGGDGGGGHRYGLVLSEQEEGEVTLVVDDNVTKAQARGDTTQVNDGAWHHVLGLREGAEIRIYIDGMLEGTAGLPAGYDLSGAVQSDVLIGAMSRASDLSIYKNYAGKVDEARIYGYALTTDNIAFLLGIGGTAPASGPLGHWAFEGDFTDSSGSGFHGTPKGFLETADSFGPLMLHYEFEDDATDSSGNSRDGTEDAGDGSLPTYEAGMVGQAIRFTDNGDHVFDDDSELYMNGLDELTISCWIKSDKTDRDEGWIHFSTNFNDQRSFRYDKDGASSRTLQQVMKYGVATNEGSEQDESSDNVQTTEWQHVAMTWQSGVGIKLYIDGLLDQPGWDAGAKGGTTSGYSILFVGRGSKDNSSGESWAGLVDDVRIYSAALSYGQIRTLADKTADLAVPPAYGPMIAGYDFEGNADDSSGNNFHGTLLGDASLVGGELILDGSGDTVDLGNDNRFNPGAGPFTVSAWFKMNSWGGSWGNIIVGKRGENGRGWQLRRRGGDQRLVFTTRGAGNDDPGGSIDPSLGEWHHVAGVRDGTSKRLYIDNQLDNDAGINGNPITMAGHNAYIGARANRNNTGPEGYFDGDIDNVKLYNLAITENELRSLAGLDDLKLPDQYSPLILHYEFEGNLDDSTDNNRTGTAFGAIGFETDPEMGEVLSLPGGENQYVAAPKVGNLGNDQVTIACWAKADNTNIPNWTLIFGFTGNAGGGGGCGSHFNIGSIGGPGGVGAHTWCWERTIFTDTEALDWRHYAMTFDGGTIRYFGDGIQIGADGFNLGARADRVHIGSRVTQGSSFPGKVDDARIYDFALSLAQIRTVSRFVPENALPDTWSGRAAAAPALEYNQAHEGAQCMRVEYTGNGAVSRLEPFGDGKHPKGWNGDFSLGQAQALSLWFKGRPDNAPGTLFAQLTTVVPSGHTQRVLYSGDPEDLLSGEWKEWNITLKALSTGKPATEIEEMGLPITKIKDVGIGIIGAGSGVILIDDVRLYPERCVPEFGPEADFSGNCIVDRPDVGILLNEWMVKTDTPQEWDRVAYYDGRYPTGWADNDVAVAVRDYLASVGYTVVNADELKTWMDARIADNALSVVVMAQDIAPDTVVETIDASCTLRKYLDAGGKIVHYADIPFYYVGHADGSQTTHAVGGSIGVLGFNAASAGWGSNNTVTITPAGADWGLTQTWNSNRPALASDVDIVLATDDDGDAAAWAKRYTPSNSKGFVRVADFDVNTGSPQAILTDLVKIAEHIADLQADLNDDGTINFLDYADLLNQLGQELLWPPIADQL
ncbi:MAG: hypothetical protein FVQ85_03520 [Planctomycetes bacterium]|nr:hypothetical protein [Planctomycetota bacterium]